VKVLFYSPLAALSYHFETDLELIKKHQDAGDEVYVIGCTGDLKKVGYFGCQGLLRCSMCQSKWNQGIDLLQVPHNRRDKTVIKDSEQDWPYRDKEALCAITYKNVDIGAAVLSTLISNIRESDPDLTLYKTEIDSMLSSMAGLCDFLELKLEELKPDLVYFFNGRFSLYRPMLRLCQEKKISFYVHERAGKLSHYSLTKNTYPHDLIYKKAEITNSWRESALPDDEKKRVAASWFDARRGGYGQSWYSFTDKQQVGLLPEGFNEKKRNIAIYISSEDEFAVIQGWENPYFANQFEGIKFILNQFQGDKDFHFYIRIHPNLKGLRNTQIKNLNSLHADNVTVIQADDPVNSYFFMDKCEKTVTFGSTIGAESVYSEKPSILVGRTLYEDMPGLIKPVAKEDLISLIRKDLPTPHKEGVLPFGFWAQSTGFPFKYFKPTNLSNGFFLNQKITGNKGLAYISYFGVFFLNLSLVFKGQMSWGFVWNRVKNKISR